MTRIYGTIQRTISELTVEGTDFRCYASEPAYKDYEEMFPGCSYYCLPRGTHECKIVASHYSPMTLCVKKTAGHRCTLMGYDPSKAWCANTILVGELPFDFDDLDEDEVMLPLMRGEATYRQLTALFYSAFTRGENIEIEIINRLFNH